MEQELRGVNLDEAFQTFQQDNNFFGIMNHTKDISRFHKIRELSLLFEKNENTLLLNNILKKSGNKNEEFLSFSKKEFNFDPNKLIDIDKDIDHLVNNIKIYEEKYRNQIKQIQSKIENLKKIFNYSNEILLTDYKKISSENNIPNKKEISEIVKKENKKDDKKDINKDNSSKNIKNDNDDYLEDNLFFNAYKKRMMYLIENYNSKLKKLNLKINYTYNLFNLIEKLVKPKFEDSKYICSICHDNTKDTFLNCGHTLCLECCKSIQNKNSKCPFCSTLITNVGKLYF